MNSKLKMLCELYDRSDESVDVDTLLKVCFFKDLKEVLELLSNKQCIWFAYLCAKSVLHLNNEKTKDEANKCLELVEKWLENPNSVFSGKLRDACAAAFDIYNNNNTYSIGACAYAAYSVLDIVSNISYYCIEDAIYCSIATINAAKNKKEQEYKNLGFLVRVIRDEP